MSGVEFFDDGSWEEVLDDGYVMSVNIPRAP